MRILLPLLALALLASAPADAHVCVGCDDHFCDDGRFHFHFDPESRSGCVGPALTDRVAEMVEDLLP